MITLLRLNDRFWPVLSLLLLGTVSLLNLMSVPVAVPEPIGSDKLYHFLAYLAAGLPVAVARPRFWLLFILSFALWGVVIELVQPLVGRTRAADDVAANLAGLAGAIALSAPLRRLDRAGRARLPDHGAARPASIPGRR